MSDTNERSVASGGSLAAGIRRCIAEYEQIAWGWDGDCGANDIISRIEEECDRIDAARPAPTLTDAEREAIEFMLRHAAYAADIPAFADSGDYRLHHDTLFARLK